MKVRMTVERDGTPLFSTIFEVTNGDISVAAPAPLNEFRRPPISYAIQMNAAIATLSDGREFSRANA